MGSEEDKFSIILDLDDKKVKKKMGDIEDGAKKSGKNIGKNLAAGFKKLGVSLVKAAAAATALGVALATVIGAKAIKAASRQEDAVNNLNQALISAGQFTQKTSQDIQDFAAELESLTTVGDEAVLEMVALAQSFVTTSDAAKELTKVALDFSAGASISFEEALRRLGRGVQGATGDIANYAPEVRKLTALQLKSGEATRILGERYAGMAAAQTKTFQGIVKQTGNSLGTVFENLGKIITQSPAVIKAIGKLKVVFDKLAVSIDKFSENNGLDRIVKGLVTIGRALVKFVAAPAELAMNTVRTLFKIFVAFAAGFNNVISQMTLLAAKSLNFIRGEGFKVGAEMTAFFDAFQGLSDAAFDDLAESQRAQLDFPISDILDKKLLAFQEFATQANKELGKVGKNAGGDGTVVDKNLAAINKKIQSFAMVAVNMTSSVIQGLTTQLLQGGKAFQSFGKTALNMMGDFAIQLGVMIIASSKAVIALKADLTNWATAGFGITAGIALIAVGAALKSFAGGPAGAASASAPAVTPVAPVGAPGGDFEGIEQKQPLDVSINIEGNLIRDTKETGEYIIDVLRDVLASNDAGADIGLVVT